MIVRLIVYLCFISAGFVMGWIFRGLIEQGKFEEEERDRAIAERLVREEKI